MRLALERRREVATSELACALIDANVAKVMSENMFTLMGVAA